ncbi:hypothetical protein ACFS5M_05785 [Lacinutrix iliipiscaria]|uniref:Lipocalin-like domain-containing protein n=1 Tax=Lacinutrix iliipiscaria TaxID=1230532 RepID=A0ABW5WLN8_9FLAO
MKKALILAWLLVLSFSLMSGMCSSDDHDDDDDGGHSNAAEIAALENTMESGNWKITYFFDTDSDETSDYTSYIFSFETDGTLVASNVLNTYTGSWSITDSSSSDDDDDDSSDDIDFNINFSTPADFVELSDDWDIILYSSTKIELIDVSGGGGGTDYLTFEKL